jgi:formylglycine-generating enzyme required for sulfatase activity
MHRIMHISLILLSMFIMTNDCMAQALSQPLTTTIKKPAKGIKKIPVDEWSKDMVHVSGGTFDMVNDSGADLLQPVSVDNFYISKYDITVSQFAKFITETGYETDADKVGYSNVYTDTGWATKNGVNWQCNTNGSRLLDFEKNKPVTYVSWNDADKFCQWLSYKTGKHYHLPTEIEWEFAARGGNQSKGYTYSGSNDINEVAWYSDNSGHTTHPVGQKKPNELGLYDMTGNVWEWCSDWYKENYGQDYLTANSNHQTDAGYNVNRGGGWSSPDDPCSVTSHVDILDYPNHFSSTLGFRIARD